MKRDWFFWIAVLLPVAVALVAAYFYVIRAPMVEDRIAQLSSLQEQQLQLFQGRVGVLLTVTTLVIGGAGALLLHFYEAGSGSVAQQRWAFLTLVTAGLSVFSGYLTYDAAIWMLRSKFFNLETVALRVPSQIQLWTSGLAVVFLVSSFLCASKPVAR